MKTIIYISMLLPVLLLGSCSGCSNNKQKPASPDAPANVSKNIVREETVPREELKQLLNELDTIRSASYTLLLNSGEERYEELNMSEDVLMGMDFIVTDPDNNPLRGYMDGVAFALLSEGISSMEYEDIEIPYLIQLKKLIRFAIDHPKAKTMLSDAIGISCTRPPGEERVYEFDFHGYAIDFYYIKPKREPYLSGTTAKLRLDMRDADSIRTSSRYGHTILLSNLVVNEPTSRLEGGIEKYNIPEFSPIPYIGYSEYTRNPDRWRVDSMLIANTLHEIFMHDDFVYREEGSTANSIAYLGSTYKYMTYLRSELYGEDLNPVKPRENVRSYGPKAIVYNLIHVFDVLESRSCDTIVCFFDNHKDMFYAAVPDSLFRYYRLDTELSMALLAYRDIISTPDFQTVLTEIRSAINNNERYTVTLVDALPYFEPVIRSNWRIYCEREMDAVYWYWFWLRRFEENNSDAFYYILLELDNHYNAEIQEVFEVDFLDAEE